MPGINDDGWGEGDMQQKCSDLRCREALSIMHGTPRGRVHTLLAGIIFPLVLLTLTTSVILNRGCFSAASVCTQVLQPLLVSVTPERVVGCWAMHVPKSEAQSQRRS